MAAVLMETDRNLNLDLDRRRRLGMVEAVWGADKTVEQILAAARRFAAAGQPLLVTRVEETKAGAVRQQLPELCYHPQARCLTMGPLPATPWQRLAILTGGSSDLPVAAEASTALGCHGVAAELIADVGVAGLHRLMARLDHLARFPVLIVCAGMEGSLPTVVAGLLPQPVIAVPVSVGYGMGAGGHGACVGMLASCAPGLCVVNIDNGYGAAMAALRILRMHVD